KPRSYVHSASDRGVVFARLAANGTYHDFARVNADTDRCARLSVKTSAQGVDHLIGRTDRPHTAILSVKPGDHGIPDELVDVALMRLDDFRFNAQHLIEDPDDLFGVTVFGKRTELTYIAKQNHQGGSGIAGAAFCGPAHFRESSFGDEREHSQAFLQS